MLTATYQSEFTLHPIILTVSKQINLDLSIILTKNEVISELFYLLPSFVGFLMLDYSFIIEKENIIASRQNKVT